MEGTGDADNEPALNGWNESDGLLAMFNPSNALDVWIGLDPRLGLVGGELVSEPMYLAARKAEIGLDPRGGASP